MKEAGDHLAQAGKVAREKAAAALKKFEDLFASEWQSAKSAAYESRTQLVNSCRRGLDEAEKHVGQWKEQTQQSSREQLDELENKAREARQKLMELNESTADQWEATRNAFNVALQELHGAYRKAKEEFDSSRG